MNLKEEESIEENQNSNNEIITTKKPFKENIFNFKRSLLFNNLKISIVDVISKINKIENKLFKTTICKDRLGNIVPLVIGRGSKNYISKTPLPEGMPDIFLNFNSLPEDKFFEFPKNLTNEIINEFGNKKFKNWKIIDLSIKPIDKEKGKYSVNGIVMFKNAEYLMNNAPLTIEFISSEDSDKNFTKIKSKLNFIVKEAQFNISNVFSNITGIEGQSDYDKQETGLVLDVEEGIHSNVFLPKTVKTQLSYQFGQPPLYRYSPLYPDYRPDEFQLYEKTFREMVPIIMEHLGLDEAYFPKKGQSWGEYMYMVETRRVAPKVFIEASKIDKDRIKTSLSERFGGRPEDYEGFSSVVSVLGLYIPFLSRIVAPLRSLSNLYYAAFPESVTFSIGEIYDAMRFDPTLAGKEAVEAARILSNIVDRGKQLGNFLPSEIGSVVKLGMLHGYISPRDVFNEQVFSEQLKDFILPMSAAKYLVKDVYLIPNATPNHYYEVYSVFKDLFPYQTGEEAAKNMFVFGYYQQQGGFSNAVLRRIGRKIIPGDVSRKKLAEQFSVLFERARKSAIGNAYGALLRMRADGILPPGSAAWNLADGIIRGKASVVYPVEVLNIIISSGVDPDVANLYFINNSENAKALPLQSLPAIMESTMSDWKIRAELLVNNLFAGRRLNSKVRELASRQILDMLSRELGFENFRNVELIFSSDTINVIKELNLEAEKFSNFMMRNMPQTLLFSGLSGVVNTLMKKEPIENRLLEAAMRFLGATLGPKNLNKPSLKSEVPISDLKNLIEGSELVTPGEVKYFK